MKNLLESLKPETLEKYNNMPEGERKTVVTSILTNYDFSNLRYMDSTYLRDALDLNLNRLVVYFIV
jgi:hypothetical protein